MTQLATVRPFGGHNPYATAQSAAARADRAVTDLIALVLGVRADGRIGDNEAHFLVDWIEQHATAKAAWPARVLYPRLLAAMTHNGFSYEEELDLLSSLADTMRGVARRKRKARTSNAIPFCKPPRPLMFEGRRFCLVGAFYSGTRAWCEQQVVARGGACTAVSERLDYLVVGTTDSSDRSHAACDEDIANAAALRGEGAKLAIVGEKHWHEHLARAVR